MVERELARAEIEAAFRGFEKSRGVEVPGGLLLGGRTN
jgi:hypothetical protein